MGFGAMEKILWVDLSTKEMREEPLDEKTARAYLGGYGLGARILFDRLRPGIDPLGPEAILGFVTGLMTGTDGVGGSRYTVVGKSPLTGGWGDANSGGDFGPYLKFSGYDAVFFTGISDKPVYLHIDNGVAEIRDASAIWGKDTFEVEDILRAEHGKDLQVACIGPAGEKVALIASVMNNKGRAAARSGLGAVMGSKKLKAVAVQGTMEVPLADPALMKELRKKHVGALTGHWRQLHDLGTPGIYEMCCKIDDAPTKNWKGVADIDCPTYTNCRGELVAEKQKRRYGCWRCPISCGGIMMAGDGDYVYKEGAHKPEYETMGMFGSNLCNDNLDSLIVLSDICNRGGVDTISAGASIAFVLECFEHGILTAADTGLEMKWGDHRAIVAMTEMLVKREGFGDIIADGVKIAAQRIGKGSEKYAMHIGGQEIAAHDPRGSLSWGFATGYGADPTPGRHNQGGGQHPPGLVEDVDRAVLEGRGHYHKTSTNFMHAASSLGLCQFVIGAYPHPEQLNEALRAITGWEDITTEELLRTGERITNVRQAFNIREGLEVPFKFPDRMRGVPPKTVGPRAGVTFTHEQVYNEYLELMDWDTKTGKPSKAKLLELGLDDIAQVLWP